MGEVSVQGKPTIIFSANAGDEAWRFKEKIVAVIGSFLQGRDDLYTFSSTSIRDIANDLENLDVAYATIDDPTDLFSFIEVRDREKRWDGSTYRRSWGSDNRWKSIHVK
jgi:hypothetical protein